MVQFKRWLKENQKVIALGLGLTALAMIIRFYGDITFNSNEMLQSVIQAEATV
jgi:hypothetical protein